MVSVMKKIKQNRGVGRGRHVRRPRGQGQSIPIVSGLFYCKGVLFSSPGFLQKFSVL